MENVSKMTDFNPFEGVLKPSSTSTERVTLPHTLTLKGGELTMVNFKGGQAAEFLAAMLKESESDLNEISSAIIASISFWDFGKPTQRRLTIDELDAMSITQASKLIQVVNQPLETSHTDDDGTIHGTLPSGKKVVVKPATFKTIKETIKKFGQQNVQFGLISKCVEIDGQPIDFVEAKLLDGIDYLALSGVVGGDSGN